MFETYFGSINIKKKQKECILDCLIYLYNKVVLSFLKPLTTFSNLSPGVIHAMHEEQ